MKVASLLTFIATLLLALPASAAPQLRTIASPDTVEVGTTTTVIVTVTPGEHVTDADLSVPAGLTVTSKQVSPTVQVNLGPNGMTQTVSARVSFRVHTEREGTFTVGPPSIVSDGTRYRGDRVTIRVVAAGSLPQRPNNPFDPFNMFGPNSPFGQGNPFDLPEPQQVMVPDFPVDPKLGLDHAREPGVFLHATVDKAHAVVGAQVTLAVYVYADVTQNDPELSDPHEVGTSEFLRQSLLKSDANIERMGYARVGGHIFAVALLRKFALFPLHAGDLEITPMKLHVSRLGTRESEDIKIRVTEPPMEHRPAGYAVGDVGHFALTADVTPREVERGAAIAVNVELSGWGNLPSTLTVPARPGVTWLEPEVKDDLHVLDASVAGAPDVWGGSRRFAFVVTPTKEGDVDLGEMSVSFYDPRTHAYDTARASLGSVHVKPGAVPPVTDDAKVLSGMPPIRTAMSGARSKESYLDDTNVFWGLLGAPTALFGIVVAGRRAARRLSERAAQRKTSPQAELKQRLRALAEAVDHDEGRAIDGATIRVLETGAMAHAGVNVRGVGGQEVTSVLERAGIDKRTATDLRDLLEACAAARFSPDGVELNAARSRATLARTLVDRLAQGGPSSEQPAVSGDA